MVYVYLADGFEEIEALAVVDILRRGAIDTKLVSVTGKHVVNSVHNIRVEADLLFEEADYENCEMIVLPGGVPGTEALRRHEGLALMIKEFADKGKYIAAICLAPTILGERGLLRGIRATVYPGNEGHLKGALCSRDEVVIHDNVITSQGPATAISFGLAILETLRDASSAKAVRDAMLVR